MLKDFADKKETFLDYKKQNFQKSKKNKGFQSPKNRTFSKGLIHAFGQKMTFFSLLKFDQNKTRNNAF